MKRKPHQNIAHGKQSSRRVDVSWKKIWHFLWYEDSVASWLVSIALAFILIKFIIYPALGLVLGTQFPVVAVVSDSMEHDGDFSAWWSAQEDQYLRFNITQEDFSRFPLTGGFNKGDIMILTSAHPEKIARGQVIVYWGGRQYPIIHRIIAVHQNDSVLYFETKGDHNLGQIYNPPYLDERHVTQEQIIGRAIIRVPYLGWVKIWFVMLMNSVGIPIS